MYCRKPGTALWEAVLKMHVQGCGYRRHLLRDTFVGTPLIPKARGYSWSPCLPSGASTGGQGSTPSCLLEYRGDRGRAKLHFIGLPAKASGYVFYAVLGFVRSYPGPIFCTWWPLWTQVCPLLLTSCPFWDQLGAHWQAEASFRPPPVQASENNTLDLELQPKS